MTVDNGNTKTSSEKQKVIKYELLPPEGGWGYLVMAALALACNVTMVPMGAFGLIFGNFLASVGDETTGTTLANGIFNTIFNFTGLAANHFLQKYSYRFVGTLGGIFFFMGSFTTVFVTNLPQLIVSFGVMQGIGMGLMIPSFFTALNCYFDKKLNLMNGVAQAIMVTASMLFPIIGKFLMDNYGFRGTIAILAAVSLNTILAASVLQPAEWHMRKKPIASMYQPPSGKRENQELQLKPLLELQLEEGVTTKYVSPKPRASLVSIGDRAMSVSTINQLGRSDKKNRSSCFRTLAKSLDLGMFKDVRYCNITIGLALGFTSDVAFISIIPLILTNAGFSTAQITLLFTAFFAADLMARILYSIVSVIYKIRNRYVFLGGCLLSALFRIAFVSRDNFLWKMVTGSCLGFLRCFIQTPLPTVIADEYSSNFATAFSLYMVVCGFVSLLFGPLMSFVKAYTQSDVMVVHLLTGCFLTCVITWTVELFLTKKRPNNKNVEK